MEYRQLPIYYRTLAFSVEIIRSLQLLDRSAAMRVIEYQVIRSSTSIAANLAEGRYAISKKEFTSFIQVSLKSAAETHHWLILMKEIGRPLPELLNESEEICRILHTIVKKSKL